MRRFFFLLLILPLAAFAQTREITLEDIYKKGTFRGEFIRADFGRSGTDPVIDFKTLKDERGILVGNAEDIIYSGNYPSIVLLRKDIEQIYRRSSKASVYFYDDNTKKAVRLDSGKLLHPTLSPDGRRIAYVKDNNLYVYDIAAGKSRAITTDGRWNHIINGNCDWVYEEEFEFTQAYEWSPSGSYIAYYRFDESKVKEYQFTMYDDTYNKQYTYKYPKAGEDNSKVEIHIHHLETGRDVKADFEEGDIYIPRIKWTRDDEKLVVYWMNRHQNHLKLLLTEARSGDSRTLYEEKNKYFVEINDDWWFLKDGKNLLFTSEMDGYRHLYLYGLDGKSKTQLTRGKFEITEVNGVDEKNRRIYYTAAWPTPLDRNLFVTDFSGRNAQLLTDGKAWHRAVFNDSFSRFYDYRSDLNTPQTVHLYRIETGKKKRVSAIFERTIGDNAKLKDRIAEYGYGAAEFIRVPNSKGDTLNGWMLKPAKFDPAKKYPVLFCNYGGPGSQQVANRFGAVSAWHQLLAQKGFIVVSVDNTGTGYRGEEFKKKTYLQLGKLEIEDQVDAANWMARLPFVDAARIGHWGWSYGGFMSSLAITRGSDVFSAAVAVAPVTSWRYYDNIYTERYMRTPQENPSGYDDNSPINHTDKIKGKYLIIHGMADDNVHFQNATQMITALVKSNINFESAYYPNKNHGISGSADNTSFHLWSKMTQWILENLGKEQAPVKNPKAF